MILTDATNYVIARCVPRVGGGDPGIKSVVADILMCSPRRRG